MKIVVVSNSLKEISACILCLLNLVRPLKWSCPVVITCPDSYYGYLEAPCPIMLGLQRLPESFSLSRGMALLDLSNMASRNSVGLHFDDVVTSHTLNMPLSHKLVKLLRPDVEIVLGITKQYSEYRQDVNGSMWETYYPPPELNMESEIGMDLRRAIESITSKIHKHIVTLLNTAVHQDREAKVAAARKRQMTRIQSSKHMTTADSADSLSRAASLSLDFVPPPSGDVFGAQEVGSKGKIFIKRFLDTQMFADYSYRTSSNAAPDSVIVPISRDSGESRQSYRASGRFNLGMLSLQKSSYSSHRSSAGTDFSDLRFAYPEDDPWTLIFSFIISGTLPIPEDIFESIQEYYSANIYPPNFILDELHESRPMSINFKDVFCHGVCNGKANTPECHPLCCEIYSDRRRATQHLQYLKNLVKKNLLDRFAQNFERKRFSVLASPNSGQKFTLNYESKPNERKYIELILRLRKKRFENGIGERRKARSRFAAILIQKVYRGYRERQHAAESLRILKRKRRDRLLSVLRVAISKIELHRVAAAKKKYDELSHDTLLAGNGGNSPSSSRAGSIDIRNAFSTIFQNQSKARMTRSSLPTLQEPPRVDSMRNARSADGADLGFSRSLKSRSISSQHSFNYDTLPFPLRSIHPAIAIDLIPQQKRFIEDLYGILRQGLQIYKHNMHGRPKIRYLYCDLYLQKLYWQSTKNIVLDKPSQKMRKVTYNELILRLEREKSRRCLGLLSFIYGKRVIYVDEIIEVILPIIHDIPLNVLDI